MVLLAGPVLLKDGTNCGATRGAGSIDDSLQAPCDHRQRRGGIDAGRLGGDRGLAPRRL